MLKTKQDLFNIIEANYQDWKEILGEHLLFHPEAPYSPTFTLKYRNKVILRVTNYSIEGVFQHELSNLYKLSPLNITQKDLEIDFYYHWIDRFSEYETQEQWTEKIKNKSTCASFATTVAINKHLAMRPHLSPKEVKKIYLFGSPWRWIETSLGWLQKTLIPHYDNPHTRPFIHMVEDNSPLAFYNNTITSHVSFLLFLKNIKQEEEATLQNTITRTALTPHSTRATDFFDFKMGKKPENKLFLGVELELEGHSQKEYKSLHILKEHAIFKSDGSLQRGVEICSAPATLDIHKEAFKLFFDTLEQNESDLEVTSRCGLHIHVDRRAISNLHAASIHLLVNKKENLFHIVKIAGREPNNYCQPIEYGYTDFTNDTSKSGNRYHMVNLLPSNTIEFRLFASTLNFKDFCKRLEFTQAVVDYTRPGETNLSITQIPLWNNFREYVFKHKKFYPELSKEM